MQVSLREDAVGQRQYVITDGDDIFELSAFGGQLVSWNRGTTPILFANREHAIVDGKTAYRGGAPICFPYFGKGPLLPSATLIAPQHGHARTTVWDAEVVGNSITLRTNQATPDGFGPTVLSCQLTYQFEDGVTITANIENRGEHAAPFQFAVHSYWAAADPAEAAITGLGEKYLDNLDSLAQKVDSASDSPHLPPFDRVYLAPTEALELKTGSYSLRITTEGGAGAVLWNPAQDHGLKDLDEPSFVCLESGIFTPSKTLAPGASATLKIRYQLQ